MPIPLTCECGRSMRVKDEAAGRKVRCPGCGKVLPVPQPSADKDVEDEALDILLTESPAEPRPPTPQREEPPGRAAPEGIRPPPPAPPPRPLLPGGKSPERPKAWAVPRSAKPERHGGGIAINPEIITGALMMLGAALWFFLGLAAGIIYFYPPVLFVLGIGAMIRGFTGRE